MPVQQSPAYDLILPDEDLDALEDFTADLGVREDVDLLLIGDGSGGGHCRPAGWGCLAYDRDQETVTLYSGALTAGTVNVAELMPYVHALWHYFATRGNKGVPYTRVGIVSDSQVTVRCGNGEYRRKANGCLWAAIDWFEAHGYELEWHHISRNSNEWSEMADWVAAKAEQAGRDLKKSLRRGLAVI